MVIFIILSFPSPFTSSPVRKNWKTKSPLKRIWNRNCKIDIPTYDLTFALWGHALECSSSTWLIKPKDFHHWKKMFRCVCQILHELRAALICENCIFGEYVLIQEKLSIVIMVICKSMLTWQPSCFGSRF